MSKLQRFFEPNQTCFVTSVTAGRQPLLLINPKLLIRATRTALRKSETSVIAWVILPDHFHAVFSSPCADIPKLMRGIKLSFTMQFQSMVRESGGLWQHRYWDHIVRSEEDLRKCLDYIHYNPVKHGYANAPNLWRYSSFRTLHPTSYTERGAAKWAIGQDGADWGE